MRRRALLTLIVLLAQVAAAAPPAPRVVTPVFHRLVAFSLPPPFKVGFERTTGNVLVREHVPEGETVDNWSRMITLQGVQGMAYNAQATPQGYLLALARGFQQHCPDTFVALDLGPQPIVRETSFAKVVSCGHVSAGGKAHSETSVMLAIQGSDDFYALEWTERGADAAHPLSLDGKYWTARLAQLGPVRLCPIVPGEGPPYPSCAVP